MQRKSNSKLLWYVIGGLVVFVIAWMATAPNDAGAPVKKKAIAKKAPAPGEDLFTQADYDARFPALLATTVKDSFKPLVYKKDLASRGGGAQLNAIPSDFAGGDANWLYTGTGYIDNVPEAVFENKTTGEGVFVQHGAHWKNAVVEQITPTTVLLSGPSGTKLLQLVIEEPTAAPVTLDGTAPASNGTAPVAPTIRGPIGGGTTGSTTGGAVIGG